MTNKLLLIVVILSFILGGLTGYLIFYKKPVIIPPTTVVFSGKPDSVKINTIIKYISKPDSNRPNQTSTTGQIQPETPRHDTTKPNSKLYTSYKTFSDSLGSYDVWASGSAPVDSMGLTAHHFAMKLLPETNKVAPFLIGYAAGIVSAVIIAVVTLFFIK